MKNNPIPSDPNPKMDRLHWHIQHWKSDLQFMEDEVKFIEQLLNSNVFDSNTLNLFERLQDYLGRLDGFKLRKTKLRELISKHENRLGSIMGIKDDVLLGVYNQKHDDLEMEVLTCSDDFNGLKAEIFNYVGGTLKRRK